MVDSGCWHWPPVLLLLFPLLQLRGQQVPAEDSVAPLRPVPTCWVLFRRAGQMVSSSTDRFPPVSSSSSSSSQEVKLVFRTFPPPAAAGAGERTIKFIPRRKKLVLQELLKHTHKESRTTFFAFEVEQFFSKYFAKFQTNFNFSVNFTRKRTRGHHARAPDGLCPLPLVPVLRGIEN